MPNLNTPFGLKPIAHKSGAPYNGAATPYFVPASYATALFIGDPVVKTGTANTVAVERVGAGSWPIGSLPEINKATVGSPTASLASSSVSRPLPPRPCPTTRHRPPRLFGSRTTRIWFLKCSPTCRLRRWMWA